MQQFRSRVRPSRSQTRHGFVLIVAMINFLIVSVVIVSVLRLATDQRKQLRYERQQLQATWLAESGLERAVNRLRSDPNYAGEAWNISPAELGGRDASRVQIQVEQIENAPDARMISVEAVFPAESIRFATRNKRIRVTVKPALPKNGV